ncbi:MAG: hypothetical protein WAM71_16645 [Candidatus Korobacteraceae bacterium]
MAVLLAFGTAMVGQNSIEYGRLPIVPQKLPNAASALASRLADQGSAAKAPSIVNVPPAGKTKAAQSGDATPGAKTAAAPGPPAIFILSNGDRLESSEYLLSSDSVQVVENGAHRSIPMSAVNVQATVAANKAKGIELKFPQNKSQLTLSF